MDEASRLCREGRWGDPVNYAVAVLQLFPACPLAAFGKKQGVASAETKENT